MTDHRALAAVVLHQVGPQLAESGALGLAGSHRSAALAMQDAAVLAQLGTGYALLALTEPRPHRTRKSRQRW